MNSKQNLHATIYLKALNEYKEIDRKYRYTNKPFSKEDFEAGKQLLLIMQKEQELYDVENPAPNCKLCGAHQSSLFGDGGICTCTLGAPMGS